MMKIVGILIMIAYLVFSGYFFYVFMKNGYDLKKTLKSLFSKCKICSMFKNTKKETDVIEIKTDEGIKKIEVVKGDLDDCEAPLGFPFDICFDPNNMTEEDKELRAKLVEILAQRKQYIIDGGKKKLIIPLEATQFLTKNLNPLVNEYGEIIIVPKEKPILEQLRHAVFTIKNLDLELEDETETELVKNLEMLKKLEQVHHEKLAKIQEEKQKRKSRKRKDETKNIEDKNIDAKDENNVSTKKADNNVNDTNKESVDIEKTTKGQTNPLQEKTIHAASSENEKSSIHKNELKEENNNKKDESENQNGVHAQQQVNAENTEVKNIETKQEQAIITVESNSKSNNANKETELSFEITKNSNNKENKNESVKDNNGVYVQQKDNYETSETNNLETKGLNSQTKEDNQADTQKAQSEISNNQKANAGAHAHQEVKEEERKEENDTNKDNDLLTFNIPGKKEIKTNESDNVSSEIKNIQNGESQEESKKIDGSAEVSKDDTDVDNDPTSEIVEDAIEKAEEVINQQEDKAGEMLNQPKIDTKTINEFYTNVLQYKHLYEPPKFDKENLIKNLKVLNDRIGISLFFNNLAKTAPLIYTDNKESVFADWKNIYIAFAMLYGSEFKSVITALLAPKMDEKVKFNQALAHVLSDYIDDHFTGEAEFCSIVLIDKRNNQKFRGYGVFFLMKGFNLGLKENQIDFFRSFPYNASYKIETIAKGLNLFEKKYPVLIGKPNEVLIK